MCPKMAFQVQIQQIFIFNKAWDKDQLKVKDESDSKDKIFRDSKALGFFFLEKINAKYWILASLNVSF